MRLVAGDGQTLRWGKFGKGKVDRWALRILLLFNAEIEAARDEGDGDADRGGKFGSIQELVRQFV